jgi:MoaA/NifB/PqqE/SkfB family radical SAM enzyme
MTHQAAQLTHRPIQFGFMDELSRLFPRLILACIAQPCNARCPHCFLTVKEEYFKEHFKQPTEHRYLPWEMWQALVDEMALHTNHTHLRISSYGETMLHKQFTRFIEYSRSKQVRTSVITNGSRMTEAISRCMIETGIESIEISAETHRPDLYSIIKVGLEFESLLKNIETLVRIRDEARSATLILVGIINQPHANPEIDLAIDFWNKRVDHVSVRHFVTWGLDTLESRDETTAPYLEATDPCPYPYERLMIDPSGKIRLCPYDNQGKIAEFGTLGTHTIKSVWASDRHNKIKKCHGITFDRERAKNDAPLCRNCEDRVNRSWTFNYLSIPHKAIPQYRNPQKS